MAQGYTTEMRNNKAKFASKSESLRKVVALQFKAVVARETSLADSISALGKSLTQLQILCQEYGQAFRKVVSQAPISMPVRTAYHYISCFKRAKNLPSRTIALIEAAGHDAAEPRVIRKVRKLGRKINKMTSIELAGKLKRTRTNPKHVRPETRFRQAIKDAIRVYVNSLPEAMSKTEARSKMFAILRSFASFGHGLSVVRKAA